MIPWISCDWSSKFKWRGTGDFPAEEKEKLAGIISKAHAHGRRVRFWGSPDSPAFWTVLLANNVDLINTDDLAGAQEFLLKQRQ